MSTIVVNLVRIVRERVSASMARGAALLALSAAAVYGLYLAVAPDQAPVAASADAVTIPPLVRAEPMSSAPPTVMHVITAGDGSSAAVPARSDRASLVRDLQAALARAHCYDGTITGNWSAKSKEAMRSFIVAVNAQLPVDNPDQALLALVQSNDTARCSPGRAISTGALGSLSSPPTEPPRHAQPVRADITGSEAAPNSGAAPTIVDARPMIERPWAPAEMLVPPKDMAPPPTPPAPIVTVSTAEPPPQPEARTPNTPPTAPSIAPPAEQVIHFEGSKVEIDPQPDAAVPSPPKAKTAKRKRAHSEDVSTSISKGFQSIQRSLSSMFE